MTDITLCVNEKCPLKDKCSRYLTDEMKSSTVYLSMAIFEFTKSYLTDDVRCVYFIPKSLK